MGSKHFTSTVRTYNSFDTILQNRRKPFFQFSIRYILTKMANHLGLPSCKRNYGIIQSKLDTYGVIQCFDNKNCLAFLYSQFNGNIEHLKINDLVEFEFTYEYDRPMACRVSKIAPPV